MTTGKTVALTRRTFVLEYFSQEKNVYIVKAMDVNVGPIRRLSTEELMLLNSGAGEDS